MTGKKLTPRVGDRVTFQFDSKTYVGNLVHPATSPTLTTGFDPWTVEVDGSDEEWRVSPEALTVVDREPVEWPEGWGKAALADSHWQVSVCESGHAGHVAYFSYEHLVKILEDGPRVLEEWDELVSGDS